MKKVILGLMALSTLGIHAQDKQKNDSLTAVLEEFIIEIDQKNPFNTHKISNSLRLQTSLEEAAQNIQNVDGDLLRSQGSLNTTEAITRNVSGSFREELHNGISADIYSRGGYINAQRNGVDVRALHKGPLNDDISTTEAVEFVKGPSSFMSALGDPSGSYNIITKKPTGQKKQIFTLTQGSFGLMRGEADLQGVIDNEEKLLYRINLMGMHKNGFIQFDHNERVLIAPTLQYKFTPNTILTAEYIYQIMVYQNLSDAQISPFGYSSLPYKFSITDPSTRPYRASDNSVYVNLGHNFDNNLKWTTQITNIAANSAGTMFWVYSKDEEDPDILNRYLIYDAMKYNTFSAQSYMQGEFQTSGIKHNFLGGLDFNLKHNTLHDTWETASTVYPLSIKNPIYSNVVNNGGIGGSWESENQIDGEINKSDGRLYYFSPYAMDEMTMLDEKLRINIGLRATHFNAHFNEYGDINNNHGWNISPRVGANYSVTSSTNVYGLYDTSFMPLIGKTENEKPLDPLKGISFEGGVKQQFFDGALSTTLSVYHITRSNVVVFDEITNTYYQSGQNKAKGIEFDLRGKILPNLNVNINYAYTDSKITKDQFNPEFVGSATPNRVRHIQNTWLELDIQNGPVKGLAFSTGYQMLLGRQERFINLNHSPLKNIFRADAGASYTKNKISIGIMVNNVFGKKQYSTGWQKDGLYYWVQLPPTNYRTYLTVSI